MNLNACREEHERLQAQIESPGFWDDQETSQKVMKRSRQLEAKMERYAHMGLPVGRHDDHLRDGH